METLEQLKEQIAELQKKANLIIEAERSKIISDIKVKVANYKITASELGFNSKLPKGKATLEPVVKYRNEAGETWSGGRGRKPQWIQNLVAAGGDIEKYRVAE